MEKDRSAWLIDLDGTLYSARPVKLAMALELALLAPHRVRVLRAFRAAHERLRHELADPVASPFSVQLERCAAECGLPREHVQAVITEWMFERPGKWLRRFVRHSLVDEIRAFRQGGGVTALVSDYPARRKLAALELRELFDVVVANGEADGPQRLKPYPDGLLLAASRLGKLPRECLVVGDRRDADGAAARAAGMEFRLVR